MSKFVKKERVAIADDAGNTIWIRAKMDVGTINKVQGAALALTVTLGKDVNLDTVPVDVGGYQTALLQYNIVAWDGPEFRDAQGKLIPCNPTTIAELDPEDELVMRVLDEIGKRNVKRASPDPKEVTTNGSMSAGGSDSTAA